MQKDLDEFVADDLPFLLRVGDPAKLGKKALGGVDVFQAHLEILAEDALHHFFLAQAEQPVVHENAGQLVANGLVQEGGRDRGIHAPAQTQHHLGVAHLAAHALAGLVDERAHRPIHGAMADMIDKVLQDLFAARCVRHFGMKLEPVKLALRVFHRGKG